MTVLVTGATGRVGGQVVAQLRNSGIRALSRKASVDLGPGVEVGTGDLMAPDTLVPALDGVDSVFLVVPSVMIDRVAPELVATLAKHVRRIVYLSAQRVPGGRPEPDGTILGSHAYLEGLIAASGAEYTFVRASGFAANTLAWAGQLRRSDVLRWFFPEARRALVHEADLAAVAVRGLNSAGHAVHHVTGPEQLSQVEQLDVIGSVLGRTLRFEEIETDRVAAELFPGAPAGIVASIIAGQAAMVTDPEPVTDTVARLTGRPARTFAEWVRDHVADFTA